MWHKEFGGFHFGLLAELAEADLTELIAAIRRPPIPHRPAILGGRGVVSIHTLPLVGPVLIKHYLHGGVLRRVFYESYLRLGRTRPAAELAMLAAVRALGVRAPEPVGYFTKGLVLYRGWLVTKLIPEERNLAEVVLADEERARPLLKELVQQIDVLIQNRVCHVDLHPGNVLVDGSEQVHIIDFDKAYMFSGSRNQLRDYYLCRWRRAVLKYNLPDLLAEMFCAGLRRVYD